MSVQLPRSTMDKLTHDSPEIRLRTLEQIEAKLLRAFAHNEAIIDFRPGDLCKQLIRWFGCKPLQSPAKVLALLGRILRSPQYGTAAIERLGAQRFQREIDKVQLLMRKRTTELPLVAEIQQMLRDHVAATNARSSSGDDLDDVVEIIATLHLTEAAQEENEEQVQLAQASRYTDADCEVPWSKPSVVDFNSMKFLADILASPFASAVEIQNALQHLQITMSDYPAEYLLQAPNIFANLLAVFERAEQLALPLTDITNTFLVFLKSLQQRLRTRHQCLAHACPENRSPVPSKTQLKVSRALELLLTKSAQQLQNQNRDLRAETTQIVQVFCASLEIYRLQELCVPRAILQKLARIAEKRRVACEQQEHCTLQRIEFLHITFLLQNMAENNARRAPLLDTDALTPLLADYTLQACFPQRYERLKSLLFAADYTLKEKFEQLLKTEQSFAAALALLLKPKNEKHCKSSSAELIARGSDICATLEKLRSLRLLELLFNAIVACNYLYVAQPELRAQACHLLLQLLQLSHAPLKSLVYQQLSQTIKKHFACLMNAESFVHGVPNDHLLSAQIIGVPLSAALLLHLTQESAECALPDVKQCCVDILAMLLKSKHLLGDTHWLGMLELLLPVLPLLQCSCTHAPQLLPLLMQLFDPDAFNLPFLAVLQGNIRFLFYGTNPALRSEALTRLIFMLHALPNAAQYVPNIMEISDLIPNDLLLLPTPRECARIFSASENFADASTLRNLIALLETHDIEPLIRKTTLMQLNVMCQSWTMTGALCADAAYFFALQALENSMQRAAYADYSDAAIPAVGLLAKALLYDSEMRQELAETPNIYILLLRALFFYQNDIQVRQDACICLFQLLFVGYLVVPGSGRVVELPLICANLQLPLKCEFIGLPHATDNSAESHLTIFADTAAESCYMRHFIAATCSGGGVGGSRAQVTRQQLAAQQQLDFASELQLSAHDMRLWRATQPANNLRRFLRAAQNATDAQTLINACITLKLQLLLLAQVDGPSAGAAIPISGDLAADIHAQLGKYLQQPPGNKADLALFEHLLELFDLCVRMPLPFISASLAKTLQNDFQHALISLLKNSEIPLRLYHKLCQLLAHLVSSPATFTAFGSHGAGSSIFYSNLYDLAAEIASQLFAQRDLQRVRCLLSLLQQLASRPLDMPDKLLLYHCKRFLTLSMSLKSFTQTGAQWQRDCLLLICRLCAQMQTPAVAFKLPPSSVKYISSLCGHIDSQVRSLSWCVLAHVARFKPPSEDSASTGAQTLINELAYLPGGCLACCLSTLLDRAELVLVRQLAGQLFVELLSANVATFDATSALITQHTFFRHANEDVSGCRLAALLPVHYNLVAVAATTSNTESTTFSTCELISCYTRIVIQMTELQSSFLTELLEKPFLFKLYELLKQPPEHSNPAYFPMCADICQLYAKFYPENFIFLQRTICRDQVWLASFCALLSQADVASETALVSMLQLLLALAKDDTAYAQICAHFAKTPADSATKLLKLFARAFTIANLNTPLQRCSLSAVCLLLVRSQARNNDAELKSFVDILECPVEVVVFETVNAIGYSPPDYPIPAASKNKENSLNAANKSLKALPCATNSKSLKAHTNTAKCTKTLDAATLEKSSSSSATSSSLSEYIFIELLRIFTHLYPTKSCKFESLPSASKIQITETLAVLLKFSPHALTTANHLKLFDKLLRILNTFLEEFNTCCSTFVRRYGEPRKLAIVRNLQLLFQLLLHWFSATAALLTDEKQALALTKVLIQLWPWMAHSGELKLLVLQLCAHLSERSLLVCTQFSTLVASYAHSVLQLVLKIVQFETTKVKAASSEEFPVISVGLRLVMNCCACAEGRMTLVKSHTLDIFDGLHPFNPKSPKIKLEILQSWLEFWELFSRYPEGAQVRNLNSLCSIINRTVTPCSATRLLSLRVLRNMCFLAANRSALMNSTDFMYTVSEVLAQPMDTDSELAHASYEEQLLVSVAIWKLISGGVKFAAQIRGTKLAKQLRMLREQLTAHEEEAAPDDVHLKQLPFALDLANVLEVIFGIFQQ